MNFLLQPWPWYITGPLIGLMVPALLIFGNKQFGISSTMRHICAACLPTKNPFFNYDWKKEIWSIFLAIGMIGGGFVAGNYLIIGYQEMEISDETFQMFNRMYLLEDVQEGCVISTIAPRLNKPMPENIFSFNSFSSPIGWIFMVLGGFLVGFGTRWANGCTSGHAIMGLSLLNPGSLVAVIGFFIGGLAVSWFVIPYII